MALRQFSLLLLGRFRESDPPGISFAGNYARKIFCQCRIYTFSVWLHKYGVQRAVNGISSNHYKPNWVINGAHVDPSEAETLAYEI